MPPIPSKPAALAWAALITGSAMLSGNLFAATPLTQGYLLAADGVTPASPVSDGKCREGQCGEGMCGEGKCGGEGRCGEGKCRRADDAAASDGEDADSTRKRPKEAVRTSNRGVFWNMK